MAEALGRAPRLQKSHRQGREAYCGVKYRRERIIRRLPLGLAKRQEFMRNERGVGSVVRTAVEIESAARWTWTNMCSALRQSVGDAALPVGTDVTGGAAMRALSPGQDILQQRPSAVRSALRGRGTVLAEFTQASSGFQLFPFIILSQ